MNKNIREFRKVFESVFNSTVMPRFLEENSHFLKEDAAEQFSMSQEAWQSAIQEFNQMHYKIANAIRIVHNESGHDFDQDLKADIDEMIKDLEQMKAKLK